MAGSALPLLLPGEPTHFDDVVELYAADHPETAGRAGTGPGEAWERFAPPGTPPEAAGTVVRNVSRPALMPLLPTPDLATGAAVIIAPGGAYKMIGIEQEGLAVARHLLERGIACFILKYRLQPTPPEPGDALPQILQVLASAGGGDLDGGISEPAAVRDAARALELVRERADQWAVDPQRIGLLGFSAGAITVKRAVLDTEVAARPAFLGYVYGSMVAENVPADAPPMFAALALDDFLFGANGFGIVEKWQQAGVPVELHAYERGNHGFGAGTPGTTSTGVTGQFADWLDSRGLLSS